ncbi:short-chain dehydrogenase [Luteitalea sp. TBR-22]|uniref:SDR family NAD(P)-dependent oxidoreductase n=1 Tax=Luteitalea sp. TBR-22 TaxID=2802971 RepID=UPI001AFB4370|nr:SDR family oxidoreductase [Luteitalea sp. TBR-22]BCS30999.1 short-chain dehydrogenase [Luteitalea sp. TBR-22]
MQTGRLAGRSIVIVGGTSGMGLSAALACRRAGARVVVGGREDAALDEARARLGADVPCLGGDATTSGFATGLIDAAVAAHGRVDGVFHVAGGSGRRAGDGPLDAVSDAGWQHTLDINLTALFLSNRAAARYFLEAGHGGSVVNMASVLARSPAPRHFATHAYAAAKAGVIGLTTSCAAYYAGRDIRFNVIAPGLVDTPMAARAISDPEIVAYVTARQPLDGGRPARASDVDGAVIYLLSDESRFVTGQVIAVDGGWGVTA